MPGRNFGGGRGGGATSSAVWWLLGIGIGTEEGEKPEECIEGRPGSKRLGRSMYIAGGPPPDSRGVWAYLGISMISVVSRRRN